MSTTELILENCILYNKPSSGKITLHLRGGSIARIHKQDQAKPASFAGVPVIDAGGRTIIPGLIDVHIQGAGGADILDGSEESVRTMASTLARYGITAFLGTTFMKPAQQNNHLVVERDFVNKNLGGAVMLGFHIEGPFINLKRRGGILTDGIYESSHAELQQILELTGGHLRMMTIAPELPGNLDIISELIRCRVVPAFAHSDASYDEARAAIDRGMSHVTHAFNAMPGLHHRTPGPLAAFLEQPETTFQLISDGTHLHRALVNILYKLLGKERCVCITDGMAAIGLPEGQYIFNGKEYESKGGAARYLDGTLIGSAMSLLDVMFRFMAYTGCSLETAVRSASTNPARVLGIESRKGSLETGKDADIVVLDADQTVFLTVVGGKVVYQKS